jgi:DNA-binding NtrC family response regulator
MTTKERLPILFVDDEPDNLALFRLAFAAELDVHTVASGEEALAVMERLDVAVLVADERMPGMTGVELLARAVERWPDTVRIIVSAYGDGPRLLAAMNRGHAHEYLLKPWKREELHDCLLRALVMAERRRELVRKAALAEILTETAPAAMDERLVGWSAGLSAFASRLERVASSDTTVLVTGETGTGKELVARAIHDLSSRRGKPFVAVNCGALAESLLESELFGHEPGAFTGAKGLRKGRFELADGGTLFLDEIGDIPQKTQVLLLRVLQERTVERVGSAATTNVDVRVVAATHRDLGGLVREGRFREDLYFRLNVVPLVVPPLRERQNDIPALVDHFIKKHLRTSPARRAPRLGADTLAFLRGYAWPGNVRELENLVQRALVLCEGDELSPDDFTFFYPALPSEASVREQAQREDAVELREILLRHGGNLSRAARALGVPRTTLVSRAKKFGLL